MSKLKHPPLAIRPKFEVGQNVWAIFERKSEDEKHKSWYIRTVTIAQIEIGLSKRTLQPEFVWYKILSNQVNPEYPEFNVWGQNSLYTTYEEAITAVRKQRMASWSYYYD